MGDDLVVSRKEDYNQVPTEGVPPRLTTIEVAEVAVDAAENLVVVILTSYVVWIELVVRTW